MHRWGLFTCSFSFGSCVVAPLWTLTWGGGWGSRPQPLPNKSSTPQQVGQAKTSPPKKNKKRKKRTKRSKLFPKMIAAVCMLSSLLSFWIILNGLVHVLRNMHNKKSVAYFLVVFILILNKARYHTCMIIIETETWLQVYDDGLKG